MITIIEEWMVTDRWWLDDETVETYYYEVIWDGSIIIFKLKPPDTVWRIVSATRTEAASKESARKTE